MIHGANATLTIPWIFPSDQFVEYEPSDELWARPLEFGIGGEFRITQWTVTNDQ